MLKIVHKYSSRYYKNSFKKKYDIVNQRNSHNLKIFPMNNIELGAHITHDERFNYNYLGYDELLCN